MRSGRVGLLLSLACGFVVGGLTRAEGQGTAAPRSQPRLPAKSGKANEARATTVELEILTEDGNGLAAQQWRSSLESLDLAISIRGVSGSQEAKTTEKAIGTLRKVTAVGLMDRSGKLIFADRTFSPGEREKLKAWVQDLKTYGAMGSPEGKPLWGLTEEQFTELFDSLNAVTTADFREQKLSDAVQALPLPEKFPVRWADSAQKRLREARPDAVVRQSTQGFTAATALAVMLRDQDLGFRPNRLPSGALELLIDVRGNSATAWPVGWPLKAARHKAAPKLFELNQVLLDDMPLLEILGQIAQGSETSILFDYPEIDRLGHDWAGQVISYPPRQATWFTVIREVLNKAKLSCDLWQDEAGRPFLNVTSLKAKRGPATKSRD